MRRAEHKGWMEETSILGYTLALTLVVLGGAELAGTNGILAVFVAGIAFDNTISAQEKWEEENVQEAVNHLRKPPAALFAGWFGPVGIAAVYYAQMPVRKTGHEEIWVLVSLVVCASVIAHGVTATPFTRWYSGKAGLPHKSPARSGQPHAHLGKPE